MSWKQWEPLLKVEDDGGRDDNDGESSGGGGGGESDIDKLRSAYDAKLADLQKKIDDIEAQKGTQDKSVVLGQVYNAAVQEVGGYLNKINNIEDAELALREAKATIESMGHLYASARRDTSFYQSNFQSALADALANSIVFEHGGDTATYKARLMKATNEDQMRLFAAQIQQEVAKDTAKKQPNQSRQPQMDRGSGTGNQRDIQAQMQEIDISTPEGQKEWQANRAKFQKALQSA